MADEENNQPKKSRGILKILMFVFGALILIGAGLGAGFLMFGSTAFSCEGVSWAAFDL